MKIVKNRKICVWLTGLIGLGILAGCAPTLEERFAAYTDTELFTQGKALYDQEDYKEALDYFLYAKEHFIRSPYAGPARFYAGGSYFAQGKYEDAADEYESFLLFFAKDPLAAEARFNLGMSYFEQSKGPERDQEMLHKALKEFQTLRDAVPDDNPYASKADEQIHLTRLELARHEYRVGNFYRKERKYEASNRRLRYLVDEYPESEFLPDAWYLQGLNYRDLDQPEEAASAFVEVLNAASDHPLAAESQKQLDALGVPVSQHSAPPSTPESSTPAVPASQIEGSILTVRNTTVTTDLLSADGVSEGMRLRVYHNDTLVGAILITILHEGFSTAEIVAVTPGMQIQEDDRVCCPDQTQ